MGISDIQYGVKANKMAITNGTVREQKNKNKQPILERDCTFVDCQLVRWSKGFGWIICLTL